MIVQWCVKGLNLPNDRTARQILDNRGGLACNWWRNTGSITPTGRRDQLTVAKLDLHINHFDSTDPHTGDPFKEHTPFISLSAGTVSRNSAVQTNSVHRARRTALWFGTDFGQSPEAYLYLCWVILAPRQAVGIEGVAEEVRDLNTYRRYSAFQTEGEITAKVIVPDNQIMACEKWMLDSSMRSLKLSWVYPNPRFTPPEQLSNVRELI